jgi:hypothetical protein
VFRPLKISGANFRVTVRVFRWKTKKSVMNGGETRFIMVARYSRGKFPYHDLVTTSLQLTLCRLMATTPGFDNPTGS